MEVTARRTEARAAAIAEGGLPAYIGRQVMLRRALAVADAVAALVAVLSIGVLFGGPLDKSLWAALFVPIWVVLAKLHGLYDRDQRTLRHLTADELPALVTWATSGTALLAVLLLPTPAGTLGGGAAIRAWAIAWSTALVLRGLTRAAWRKLTPPERGLVVGRGRAADAIRRKLELFPDIHVRVVEERDALTVTDLRAGPDWLGSVDRILLGPPIDEEVVRVLAAFCRDHQIRLSVVPPVPSLFGTAVQLNHVADLPLVEYSTWDVSRSTLLLKRVLDVVVGVTGLLVLSPALALIAVAIVLDSGRPVLFRQARATTGGRTFTMLKLRTMVHDAEELLPQLVEFDDLAEPAFKLSDDPRVTRVGRLLRRWSLDELPQLVNVVRGDMSLVGPRPEQVELVRRYRPEHRFRLAVRPGMTGPMQVFGRGHLSFEERLAVERDYVENLTLRRDLRILALTFAAIASGRGAF